MCDQVRIAPFTRLPRHCRHCQLTTTLGCTFMNTPTFWGMRSQTWNIVARIRDQTDYVPRELDSCNSVPNYYNGLRLKVSERCPCLDMKFFSGGRNKYAFGKINIYILSNTVQMENHKHCDPLSSLVTYFVSKQARNVPHLSFLLVRRKLCKRIRFFYSRFTSSFTIHQELRLEQKKEARQDDE